MIGLILALGLAGVASAQDDDRGDDIVWTRLHASVFADAPIERGDGVVDLDTPKRAVDATVVPVAIRTHVPDPTGRFIETIWLIVDNNPSPVAAIFHFTPQSGRADVETRIRVEQYTHVRAVARTNDGRLFMTANYVKASGGCTAPRGNDPASGLATLGRMRMQVEGTPVPGRPILAQLMISHPNDSGLAMDPIARTYAAAHYVRTVKVTYAGKPVMRAEVDFSISENPNFRFYFTPGSGGQLEATIVDNQDQAFSTAISLESIAGAVGGRIEGQPDAHEHAAR
ncbi:MAG TPA: quinoprotein dehydrogenase-associated SoxYZ-like carrier [Casimicrobiaceae bacterium]|nr:quinoprotein dehydrogenase-associated SoxYZ-like carrier [Casimicrobiaceae bacterium]